LIYAYFGSKQGLFDALAEMHVRGVLDTVPIDAHHLPEYAARLYDYNRAHPQLVRLVGWFALEGMQSPLLTRLSVESMAHKIQAIQAAQAAGAIHSALSAEDLLTIVLSISNAWELGLHSAPSAAEDDAQTAQTRRAAIVEAVRKLVE
jgi:AcrR family transcriptional regulator